MARRKSTAGCQYSAAEAGSAPPRTKFRASGDAFQATTSTIAATASGRGRQSRSDSASTTSGIAAKRRRETFSPTADGTTNAAVQAAR